MSRRRHALLCSLLVAMAPGLGLPARAAAAKGSVDAPAKGSPLADLPFRNLGPAVTSGRVGDIAVDPRKPDTWYVAVASGGVWKTVNAGTTWTPIFDKETSFSIGCVTVDPHDSNVIWAGTGENNSQRSVAYGDGIYRSLDGGLHWENLGLKTSEHIAKIVVDPRNSQVVYVAAQGRCGRRAGNGASTRPWMAVAAGRPSSR